MKRSVASIVFSILFALPLLTMAQTSVGVTPATGVKIVLEGGTSFVFIPLKLEAEVQVGNGEGHAVGGEFGFDIGTGIAGSYVSIKPKYRYYFSPGEDGPYAGAYFDWRIRSGASIVGLGGLGGYTYALGEHVGVFGEAEFGISSVGFSGPGGRGTGVELGFKAGARYSF